MVFCGKHAHFIAVANVNFLNPKVATVILSVLPTKAIASSISSKLVRSSLNRLPTETGALAVEVKPQNAAVHLWRDAGQFRVVVTDSTHVMIFRCPIIMSQVIVYFKGNRKKYGGSKNLQRKKSAP